MSVQERPALGAWRGRRDPSARAGSPSSEQEERVAPGTGGRQVRGGGEGHSPPPVAPPHTETPGQLPSTRAWASLGKARWREGGRGPTRGTEKESSQGMPLQPASTHVSHGYCGGWVGGELGSRGEARPTDLMSIKAKACASSPGFVLSSGHLGQK